MDDKIKIIVIDDEIKMTKLLKLILDDHFYCSVETFTDPQLAFQRMTEEEFDVISLDHRMPGLTGMEIVRRLRTTPEAINHKTPILVFTGFREEAERLSLDLLNDLFFLEKPVQDDKYVYHIKIAYALKKKKFSKPV